MPLPILRFHYIYSFSLNDNKLIAARGYRCFNAIDVCGSASKRFKLESMTEDIIVYLFNASQKKFSVVIQSAKKGIFIKRITDETYAELQPVHFPMISCAR